MSAPVYSTAASTQLPGLSGRKYLGSQTSLFKFFGDPISTMLSVNETCGRVGAVIRGDTSVVCAFGPEYNQQILSDTASFCNVAEVPFPVPSDSAVARFNRNLAAMNGAEH